MAMNEAHEKLNEIKRFMKNYVEWSQQRGIMYGSIAELESNWRLLDNLFFILNNLHEEMNDFNFSAFLKHKGFGAKNATLVIKEKKPDNPYLELNNLWNEYIDWTSAVLAEKGIETEQ